MFLTSTDFKETIKDEILIDIQDGDTQALPESIESAVDIVSGFLNGIYDTTEIFNKTGTARNKTIVAITLDIALYRLHKRTNPRQIPEIRRIAYEDALTMLEKIQKRMVNPVGLPAYVNEDGDPETISRFGSNRKMNHFY